jgi:DNA repair protein RecN (Recombination protein N)
MLAELSIRDLVLIPRITLRFGPGLNVLSGETGAGKSLVVGSLRLLCGEKPPADPVRPGAERAIVEGVFELDPDGWIVHALAGLDIDAGDGELILRREIPAKGRGRVRANGLAIPLETLRRASELLVDLHGQHDHQSLLRPSYQAEALDEFAGLLPARDEFAARLGEWRTARDELEELGRASREDRERRELARFQRRELEEADPQPGERAELVVEHGRLERAEFLRDVSARCADTLLESERSLQEILSELAELAEEAAGHDPEWVPLAESLGSLAIGAAEAARDASALGERAVDDPERLQEVRDRLRVWDDLLRKYGPGEEDVLAFRDRLRAEEDDPDAREKRLEALRERVEGISDRLLRLGTSLRRKRRAAARDLEQAVEAALAGVGMEGARFEVEVHAREQGVAFRGEAAPERAGPSGLDRVELLLAANPGRDPRPLRSVASGGEISRVMLGLKSVLGRVRGTATMVFDEIDAGVGGTVAARVGETLAGIGASRQVLCITHLAAIASRAGTHFRVRKDADGGSAATSVEPVEGEERVREIARMLGGAEPEGVAVEHARELLKERT